MTYVWKTYQAEVKALPAGDGPRGLFEAKVASIGNVDRAGDRVMPGAFDASIKTWQTSGDPVPVIFSHDWGDPFSHIGYVDPGNLKEMADGLYVKGQLDIADNPVAAQVFRLMERRTLKEFSFGYEIDTEATGKDGANELRALTLVEVGPTLKGANPETQLLGVKAAIDEFSHKGRTDDKAVAPADLPAEPQDATKLTAHINAIRAAIDACVPFCNRTMLDELNALYAALAQLRASAKDGGRSLDVKHANAASYIQRAHDALAKAGAKCADTSSQTDKDDDLLAGKSDDPDAELRALIASAEEQMQDE